MSNQQYQSKIMAELYDHISAEFYDYHAKRGDIKFYVDAAVEAIGPVLELGCGTGRILIPTAQGGIKITGLDKSREMLGICKAKLDKEPDEVRDRVNLVNGDMRSFELKVKYSLVTITFGPFNYLAAVGDQIACLHRVHRHLKNNGALLFDLFYLDIRNLAATLGTDIVHFEDPFIMPDGRSVTWGIHRDSVDYNRQILHETLFYNVRRPDGTEERLRYHEELHYFFCFEIEHLLARTGFRTEAIYADFDKSPFGSSYPSELIVLARKVRPD